LDLTESFSKVPEAKVDINKKTCRINIEQRRNKLEFKVTDFETRDTNKHVCGGFKIDCHCV
jgi:hypothetical protein